MTKQYYLIGENIEKSYSPLIHRTIYDEMGFDACYSLFVPTKQDSFLPKTFDGLNVTAPYKTRILDYLFADVTGCGSVNTVVRWDKDGVRDKLFGYSTDGEGFAMDADRLGLDLSDILLVGTGGAAHSLSYTLCQNKNSKVSVFGRDKAKQLAFEQKLGVSGFEADKKYSLAINCTPDPAAVDFFAAKEYYDLGYNFPAPLSKKNRHTGLGMLIFQAIFSDMMFFEKEIPLEIFDVVLKTLSKRGINL